MKKFLYCLVFLFLCHSCKNETNATMQPYQKPSGKMIGIQSLKENLDDSHNKEIMVASHRGDWRNAPENSLQAIRNCIKMGVDIVEIDVRKTKDNQLVIMHDKTLDRTTNGKGLVKDWTLDSLKTLRLKDGLGVTTQYQIPTLEEALLEAKGKILVNLDKSYDIFDECYKIAKKTGTLNQIIIKGVKTYQQARSEFGEYLDKVYFMPIVRLPDSLAKSTVDTYLNKYTPVAFEFTVPQDTLAMIQYFDDIRAKGSSVWVNALWPPHNGGHDDEKAAINPTVYDWYIENNVDIIQTDRPQLLLDYLRSKGLHN
jgi:glycerophosphoryl diester phosphodiesterase